VLTPARQAILELIEGAGAVGIDQIAELYKRNKRTAYAQIKYLTKQGLIGPNDYGYRLLPPGQAWLRDKREIDARLKRGGFV
jgi:DeoR/GlpR family transcriptional regulator of sugar metabolism